jgi:Domain of unknown function (DUF222)
MSSQTPRQLSSEPWPELSFEPSSKQSSEPTPERSDRSLSEAMDEAHRRMCSAQRELLALIAEADRRSSWIEEGAWSCACFLAARYGITRWKAHRWIAAAHALEGLPEIAAALSGGELSLDKTVELTRLADSGSEHRLLRWAKRTSAAGIRRAGDLAARADAEAVRAADTARFVSWSWFDEDTRFSLSAELPAADGAIVARAIERLAGTLPESLGEDDPERSADARRADALVAMCSVRIGADADPDRASIVVHAPAEALADGRGRFEIEGGPLISSETVRRLCCTARVQWIASDATGRPLSLGRMSREPPAWMLRELRHRDRECVFPGCGMRRFVHAHHVRWWDRGGRTELDNLALVCVFHHKLVHEHGWTLRRQADGTARWFHPDGTAYRAGPEPAREAPRPPPRKSVA